jgi:putative transposase
MRDRRRRYVATTDSEHDQPIYTNRTKELTVDGPNQLWVADITYVAIAEGFAYIAVILDAWSRRAIGYAISRSIDVRLTLAALNRCHLFKFSARIGGSVLCPNAMRLLRIR